MVNLLNQIKAVDRKVDDKTGPLMEMQTKLRQLDTVVAQASQLRNQMPEQQNANQIQQINIKDSFNTAMSEIDLQKFHEMEEQIKKLNESMEKTKN